MKIHNTLVLVVLYLFSGLALASCGDDEPGGGEQITPETITVAITSPASDSYLTEVTQITVEVTGEVVQVDLVVNEEVVMNSTTPPFTLTWDTSSLQDACYQLKAVAHGARGTEVTSEVCRVNLDRTAPTVAFADIGLPILFSDRQEIPVDASDEAGLAEVRLLVGGEVEDVLTESPFTFTFDTTGLEDGALDLAVEAEDKAGNSSGAELTGMVVNEGIEPEYLEDNIFTWTIPGNWRVVDFHRRLHFTMPSGITRVMAVIQWDRPEWDLELAIGTGICPHQGVRYAYDEAFGGQLIVTHTAEELSLSEYPQGETWFLHLAPGTELNTTEALDANMLESTDVAMMMVLY
ncbi:MAG: hypothetical protein JW797_07935 [Bradymonadales bacterium]|nr:hypothetical protein [Bradymonadales bacterium]